MLDERLGHHVVALVCAGLLILRPCRVGDDACAGRVALAANGVAAQLWRAVSVALRSAVTAAWAAASAFWAVDTEVLA